MKPIKFSPEERDAIVARIQRYFVEELDQSIGNIPAEFLLEFFSKEIGGYFYNRGLYDAQAVFAKSLDTINDEIYGLEQREAGTR